MGLSRQDLQQQTFVFDKLTTSQKAGGPASLKADQSRSIVCNECSSLNFFFSPAFTFENFLKKSKKLTDKSLFFVVDFVFSVLFQFFFSFFVELEKITDTF